MNEPPAAFPWVSSRFSLDDLYGMVAQIYSEQNIARTTTAIFAAFVEACGMLTIHESKKARQDITVTDALCWALGWYLTLLFKMKIKSLEEILYRKFPYACPYCFLTPHNTEECKKAGDSRAYLNNSKLQQLYVRHEAKRPIGLDDWQSMFQDIYPRSPDDGRRSLLGLFEELGELAESIRVFGKDPKYFVGEAADAFSYLMGIANEHKLRLAASGRRFSFEEEFIKRYPGLCIQCGCCVCVCPAVPRESVSRPGKELAVEEHETLFLNAPLGFTEQGQRTAHAVRSLAFSSALLAPHLPIDRGHINNAFAIVALLFADALRGTSPEAADRLAAQAVAVGTIVARPRDKTNDIDPNALLDELSRAWAKLAPDDQTRIKSSGGLLTELCEAAELRSATLRQV
jgi:NTP pyrophosphatase (non-canonical NTP hydrolase)